MRYVANRHSMLRDSTKPSITLQSYLGVFRYSRRAVVLVWSTHKGLTVALAVLTVTAGVLPAGIAYVGKLIVDAVVAQIDVVRLGGVVAYGQVLLWVLVEGLLVAAMTGVQRGIGFCQALLRVLISQRVNVLILEKALTLELAQFEDSEFYDKLNRARQEASSRPLSLVNRTFGLAQHSISLVSYGGLLVQFSPWAVLILLAAGLPAFIAEVNFSGEQFRIFRWRSPQRRMLMYLEMVLAREDHAKEVKLFGLGRELLDRYRNIFRELYKEDRSLAIRRGQLGLRTGCIRQRGFLRHLRVDRDHHGPGRHFAGRHDDVPAGFQTGASLGQFHVDGDRRHVRGQSVSLQPVRIPGAGVDANARHRHRGPRSRRRP